MRRRRIGATNGTAEAEEMKDYADVTEFYRVLWLPMALVGFLPSFT